MCVPLLLHGGEFGTSQSRFNDIQATHQIVCDVILRRNALDTCVANYRQLFAQGKNQSYDLTELGEYYLEYLRIMAHWERIMPGRILTVRDLEGQVRRLLAHCGLPFDERCLRFHESQRRINTASSEQVREPIYQDAVGYWKHYDSKLGQLRQILAPVL